jgi:hypothetical protein
VSHREKIAEHAECIRNSALGLLVGDRLGGGAHREVYALRHDDTKVIKVEYVCGVFANVHEFQVWDAVKGTDLARWFAPVVFIDTFGNTLIMGRTKPISDRMWNAIEELPAFLEDLKQENFGIYKGRVVCHDYGYTGFIELGMKSKKMKRRGKCGHQGFGNLK